MDTAMDTAPPVLHQRHAGSLPSFLRTQTPTIVTSADSDAGSSRHSASDGPAVTFAPTTSTQYYDDSHACRKGNKHELWYCSKELKVLKYDVALAVLAAKQQGFLQPARPLEEAKASVLAPPPPEELVGLTKYTKERVTRQMLANRCILAAAQAAHQEAKKLKLRQRRHLDPEVQPLSRLQPNHTTQEHPTQDSDYRATVSEDGSGSESGVASESGDESDSEDSMDSIVEGVQEEEEAVRAISLSCSSWATQLSFYEGLTVYYQLYGDGGSSLMQRVGSKATSASKRQRVSLGAEDTSRS